MTIPHHPYTQTLIHTIPNFDNTIPHKNHLNTLPDTIPLLKQLPINYRLKPHYPYTQRKYIMTPHLTKTKNHLYTYHFPLNIKKK